MSGQDTGRLRAMVGLESRSDLEQNRRVLIVDDDGAIHEDFRGILAGRREHRTELDALQRERFGGAEEAGAPTFELDSAYQGAEAVEMVKAACRERNPYALAFVDLRMPPGIDGIRTTALLLEEDRELGIVLCCANSDHGSDDVARAFGETDRVLVLKKPLDPVEVRQLAQALQSRWELGRLVQLKMEDLALIVDVRTAELKRANERLEAEAAVREDALRRLATSNEQIKALAYEDWLTGLASRRLLNEQLEKVLARARRRGTEFAVLFLDFDFKLIKDGIGRHATDALLKKVADSLSELMQSEDVLSQCAEQDADLEATISMQPVTDPVLSRLGGDEFVILLPETRDRLAPGSVASRILGHLEQPIRAEDTDVVVTASIGIATYPEDGQAAEALIRNANTAMYHARQKGRAVYEYYSAAMNAASIERPTLESGSPRRR